LAPLRNNTWFNFEPNGYQSYCKLPIFPSYIFIKVTITYWISFLSFRKDIPLGDYSFDGNHKKANIGHSCYF